MFAELLGVPRADRAKLFEWSNALIAEDDTEYRSSPEAVAEKIASIRGVRTALVSTARL